MVSEFIVSPRRRALHVWIMGGSLEAVDALIPQVEAFGRLHGCEIGGASGRKGWLRYLKKHGYAPETPCVGKEL